MSIRVLHYVGKMNRGGMETFIMNLYRKIDREKIRFDFAVHGNEAGDYESEIKALGGEFHFFPHMRKNPLKYRKAWREFWSKNKYIYAAFHMHTNSLANVIALEEAKRAGIPIRVLHSHSSMANKGRLQWLNDCLHKAHQKKIADLATDFFACSDKAADWLFGKNRDNKICVQQINNGIDTKKFKFCKEARDDIRAKFGLADATVIGHVGAFIPVKNHRFFIDVIEKAHEKDPSVRGVLIGDGPLMGEIKDIVHQKNMDDIILFLGVCDNVYELLSAMDAFLMPSLYEGLPVSLVEVQANGLPALVSDSITKDVKLRDNLYYSDLADGAQAWADRLLNVLSVEERATDLECIITKGFDIMNTVAIYEKILMKGREN